MKAKTKAKLEKRQLAKKQRNEALKISNSTITIGELCKLCFKFAGRGFLFLDEPFIPLYTDVEYNPIIKSVLELYDPCSMGVVVYADAVSVAEALTLKNPKMQKQIVLGMPINEITSKEALETVVRIVKQPVADLV